MATIRVSSNSQLSSALKSAGSGDTISLSGGTYNLSLKGENVSGAKIAAASGANVTFSHVSLNNVQNLTFDGVKVSSNGSGKAFEMQNVTNITVQNSDFKGGSSGMGFWVNRSDDVSFVNNTVKGFQTGLWLGNSDDLSIRNNTISGVKVDGMIIGHVHDTVISGNSISLGAKSGTKHSDGIQFYNSGTNDPLRNVTVSDNRIETNNPSSHALYMNNEFGNKSSSSSVSFKNITIDHNTVVGGQVLGIAVGQTSGLKVTDNILLQDTSTRSSSDGRIPQIRVEKDSTGVTISGNVVHKTPGASGDNWQLTKKAEPGWSIANNKIVSIGTSVKTAEGLAPKAGAPDAVKAAGAASAAASAPESSLASSLASSSASSSVGDGHADIFRFNSKNGTDKVSGLHFGEGDKLVLQEFDRGTFHDQAGGNPLVVKFDGMLTKIDSLADLRELDKASPKVSIHTSGDTLVLDIDQKAGHHVLDLAGLGHAYADLI
jgi:parallel beta-helix repeat protein